VSPWEHLFASAAAATLLVQLWHRPELRSGRLAWAGLVALLPIFFWPLPIAVDEFVTGKEGVIEVFTSGVLGALLVRAWQQRQPWVGAGAALLLLEELDYGQWIFAVATPQSLLDAGSRSGNLNSHNLPGMEVLWRMGPLLLCVALALRERWPPHWEARAVAARLPRLHVDFVMGSFILLLSGLATLIVTSDQHMDESGELAAAVLVALCWRAREDPGCSTPR